MMTTSGAFPHPANSGDRKGTSVIRDNDAHTKICDFIDEWYPYHDREEGNGILLADGFEKAFIGVGAAYYNPPCAVYDYDKCVEILIENGVSTYEEAVEYFEFNVSGAYVGPQTPIFMRKFEEVENFSLFKKEI